MLTIVYIIISQTSLLSIRLPYYDGKSKRIVILRKNPISNYFIESLTDIHHDGVPSEKDKNRGHLIAQSFKEFLFTTDELSSFKNEVNIFLVDKIKQILLLNLQHLIVIPRT